MKRIILTFFISLIIITYTIGQKWTYSSGGNAFDGQYKTSSITGTGGKFPYNKPVFVVNLFENNQLNVYLSQAGYAGCDNKIAYIKFDNDSKLYTFGISTNSDRDVWFLQKDYKNEQSSLSIPTLLEKLKIHNKFYVRLSGDCGQNDYEFSLLGSSVAIDYVTSDYFDKQKKNDEKKQRIIEMISSGNSYKTIAYYNASILYEPKSSSFYKSITLKKGEKIIFSGYSIDKEFCILEKATTVELPEDTIFYISKSAINLETVEKVE